MYFFQKNRGFTLVEMMVVITIIALLTGVVLTAVFNARKESRDMSRITDLQQYKLGLKLYKEANGEYPSYPDGIEVGVAADDGDGNSFDADIAQFVAVVKSDPASGGSGSDFNYWYFTNFDCNGNERIVLTAQSVENEKNGNAGTVCGDSVSFDHAYILIVD